MPRGATASQAAPPPQARALPPYFELTAPSAWRTIDILSDLHLSESMPRTFAAWAQHLRQTPADAVFILGDLFEVWVGDDMRTRPFESACLHVLADAASHRQLAFMAGNRDFLLGDAARRAGGLMALPDPTLLAAWGQTVLLTHGDALCIDDLPYQEFRRQVRSDAWQADFLSLPLAERLHSAAEMRSASQARREQAAGGVDIDPGEAVRWLHAMGAAEMVHGHTHRPGSATLAPGFKRHVLSDWDLDSAQRAEVLRLTRGGFERVAPAGS